MTLQWTFVAAVLYLEIFIISLLMLPFISPTLWQKIFRSSLVNWLSKYSGIYFYVFIAILVLLFAESVREVRKYSQPLDMEHGTYSAQAETLHHMKLFRAQRNLYISGFAMFQWFVLRRMVILIANEATLMAESEAARRQAQSATAAAQALLDEKTENEDNSKNATKAKQTEEETAKEPRGEGGELKAAMVELEDTKEQLYKAKVEFDSMKKQAESTNKEYDRLLLEHESLQKKLAALEGSQGDKKGD